jgi:TolB-like protein
VGVHSTLFFWHLSATQLCLTAAADTKKPALQSVAVLPFVNRSALEADVFFVDGVHDDLLTLLSRLGDLKVISRTSVERFRDTKLGIPELARQLGVATVLEGAGHCTGAASRTEPG